MRSGTLVLAVLALLPAFAVGIYLLAGDIALLTAPTWSSSQPRGTYLAMVLAVKGALFAAIGVAAYGIAKLDRRIGSIGAGGLVLAAIPLMLGGGGIVIVLSALMVGAVSWRPPRLA